MMELHSEAESYRRVLPLRTPEGEAATVIVMRRKSAIWPTFDGAMKTTVVMTPQESGHLVDAVTEASTGPR
ncbi:MAG: hypothetical protein ABR608_13285 [Pseudonocardiaceae bacterium]